MFNQDNILETPIQYMKGVGTYLAKRFNTLNIKTVFDILYFFPRTYDDFRNITSINQVEHSKTHIISGRIISVRSSQKNKKIHVIKAQLKDSTGQIESIWFNQKFLIKSLKVDSELIIKGKIEWDHYAHTLSIKPMETIVIKSDSNRKDIMGKILPIYSLTTGFTQQRMRAIIQGIFKRYKTYIPDPYPTQFRETEQLMSRRDALYNLHYPSNTSLFKKAQERVIFDEFMLLQLPFMLRKQQQTKYSNHHHLKIDGDILHKYMETLPYTLTQAQKKTIEEVKIDIRSQYTMNRLLQGDVGSGKTDVAIITLLFAIDSEKKGALLVPTEVLAQQHYEKLRSRLKNLGITVVLIKGKMNKKEKENLLIILDGDDPLIVIGTHALIDSKVKIKNVAVTIIDEQHRFGVFQRKKLVAKGKEMPHCLFMTATPIPRTLTLTVYGDLSKSIIDEMPAGRIPIKTYFTKPNRAGKVYQFCKDKINNKEQIFMVYPLVEESETLDLESAIKGYEQITKFFSESQVGLIHGRLKPQEKAAVMEKFKNQEIDILVATTVIEVGVDIPNATTMVIHNGERYGLSQLHQLRGRVGRGGRRSECFLIADPKTESSKKRIKAMLETTDGFKLAEYDLMIRGPGDMLGTRQSGDMALMMGDLVRDKEIYIKAENAARNIIEKDPLLVHDNHNGIRNEIEKIQGNLYRSPLN